MQDFVKELDTAIYQARYRITQNNSGGQNTVLNIVADNGTRMIIDYASIKYSSGGSRTTYIVLYDNDDNVTSYLAYAISVGTNSNLTVPSSGNIQSNNSSGMQKFIIANGDYIQFYGFSLQQNEYIDVTVRGRIRGRLPLVNTSLSTGDVTLTTSYARIV